MEFLSSPIHNYSYETFDDAFFELPKEMDFELDNEFRDGLSHSMTESDDLNDGMYGVWNAKHPWTVNNNSNSLYNSNLHLDFIGGDPESAMMVNPNVVLPNGFNTEDKSEDSLVLKQQNSSSQSTHVPEATTVSEADVADFTDEDASSQPKKVKSKLVAVKETVANGDCIKSASPKNGIRVLKPTVIESNMSSTLPNASNSPQIRTDSNRLKTSVVKNSNNLGKCSFYYQSEAFYPKPAFSYSCLIAMALKNSKHGCLPVAEIYNFMCNHFPYFKTAPNGWKNSVRHNLSLNKCFEKIEKPAGSTQRKGCLWALNPSKAAKLEEEVQKCAKKDVVAIKKAMEYPEHLELLERGELKSLYDTEQSVDDDDEDMDTNEDDTEGEEHGLGDDDAVEDQLSETEEQNVEKVDGKNGQYPVLNVPTPQDLPEFKIEVDDSIYEELIGTIKNEQLFTVNGAGDSSSGGNPLKKVKKYFIQVSGGGGDEKAVLKNQSESETYDHYDINNFLRLENEMKLSAGKRTPPRFTKRIVPAATTSTTTTTTTNSRIKPIKFKTWD